MKQVSPYNLLQGFSLFSSLTAPSAAPTGVTVTGVTAFNISIQWGEVLCPDQNGVITGYSVQYGAVGSGGTETATVDGDSSGGSIRLSGLEAATVYEYRVAAMTSAGPEVYSSPMTALTSGTYLHSSAYTCVFDSLFPCSDGSNCNGILS